jgi:hypothetical protein
VVLVAQIFENQKFIPKRQNRMIDYSILLRVIDFFIKAEKQLGTICKFSEPKVLYFLFSGWGERSGYAPCGASRSMAVVAIVCAWNAHPLL